MKLEEYFEFLASDDIRIKGSRIGIESILYGIVKNSLHFCARNPNRPNPEKRREQRVEREEGKSAPVAPPLSTLYSQPARGLGFGIFAASSR